MTLSGDVSDYDAGVIAQAFAIRFSVPVDAVNVTIASGSVVLTVTVTSLSDATTAEIRSALSTTVDADSLIGCNSCNTSPAFVTCDNCYTHYGLSTGEIVGIVIGSVCGVLLLIGLIYFLVQKSSAPKKEAGVTMSTISGQSGNAA
jgi:hypothetical protein